MINSLNNSSTKSLHIIRGIAALVVVIYHAKFILWAGGTIWLKNEGFKHFYDYGLFGIDLLSSCGAQCVLAFFVLSGFVIHHSFQHSDRSLRHFYLIRVIRIYTPYLFSLALSLATLYFIVKMYSPIAADNVREYNTRLLQSYSERGVTTTIKALIFLPAREYAGFNFAYWSLLHEAIFYSLFPLYFFAGTRNRILLFFALVAAWVFTRNNIIYYQLYFLAGMFLYDYYAGGRKPVLAKRSWYIPLILGGFCITNLLTKFSAAVLPDLAALLTVGICFDYLLHTQFSPGKFFKLLADMSFSLYLNHLWILLVCYAIWTRYLNSLIIYQRLPYYLGVLICLPVSWVIYVLVEKRSLGWIRRLKGYWAGKSI